MNMNILLFKWPRINMEIPCVVKYTPSSAQTFPLSKGVIDFFPVSLKPKLETEGMQVPGWYGKRYECPKNTKIKQPSN